MVQSRGMWSHNYFDHVVLVFCPPCIVGLANFHSDDHQYALSAMALTANILLYALMGSFIWLGIKKSKAFLAVPIMTVGAMAWWGVVFLK